MASLRPVAEAENRLARFNDEREGIVREVARRVVEHRIDVAARAPDQSLEYLLNDVAFSEIKRYESNRSRDGKRKLDDWRGLAARLGPMPDHEKEAELRRLVEGYAGDVAGNFNPAVYRFARDILPSALSFLLNPISSFREGVEALGALANQIRVEGPMDVVRTCAQRGTLIVTPTHSSNLDSIVLGFGLQRSGLPPVTYGAGKNLFSNPFISYFMHNLGAYKVDRRLKFDLYKDVLKEYSTVLLERGYHSLFFPGGTRSRSNEVEPRLKLGLLGTGVVAYGNNLMNGRVEGRIYVCPVTINYRLCLEAETLIEDYLAETGKSRYIIEDDEFSRLGRILEFVRKILAHEGAVVLRFARPCDPFGNEVDDEGDSRDRRGRPVDPSTYLRDREGRVTADSQRDFVYTRALGERISEILRRETVYLSSHLVARAVFDAACQRAGTRDILRLLRYSSTSLLLSARDIENRIDRLRRRIDADPACGSVDARLAGFASSEVLSEALRALGTYHTKRVVFPVGERLQIGSMRLLYYYANRTAHLEREDGA